MPSFPHRSILIFSSCLLLVIFTALYRQEELLLEAYYERTNENEHATSAIKNNDSVVSLTTPPPSAEILSCSNYTSVESCRSYNTDCTWCEFSKKCHDDSDNTTSCVSCTLHRSFIGGIGNRLWQLVSFIGMNQENKCRLYVDNSSFSMIQEVFDVKQGVVVEDSSNISKFIMWREAQYDLYRPFEIHQNNNHQNDVWIDGFLQNYRYLAASTDSFANKTRSILSFRPEIQQQAVELLHDMSKCTISSSTPSTVRSWIGLHYRRFPDRHKLEPPPTAQQTVQFVNSLLEQCMVNKYQNEEEEDGVTRDEPSCKDDGNMTTTPPLTRCCVLVVSNDPEWARKYLSTTISCVRFVDNEFLDDPAFGGEIQSKRNNGWATMYGRDMCVLAMTNTLVLTVGSYGYFAGILSSESDVYLYRGSHAAKRKYQPSTWKLWG